MRLPNLDLERPGLKLSNWRSSAPLLADLVPVIGREAERVAAEGITAAGSEFADRIIDAGRAAHQGAGWRPLERLPVHLSATALGTGPAMVAGELLGRVRAELPVIGRLGEREQVLMAAWLTGLRSARTRRAYAADVAAWLGWLTERQTSALAAGRVHVDLWAATQLDTGAAASSVRRRLSALSSFYRYCAAHDLICQVSTPGCGPASGGSGLHRHGGPGPGPGPRFHWPGS